jgi:hypothetical protein
LDDLPFPFGDPFEPLVPLPVDEPFELEPLLVDEDEVPFDLPCQQSLET